MGNTIIYLILLLSILINQSVYASMDEALDEFPEQELYLPDEPEYYEDEYYYEEVDVASKPIDIIIENTVIENVIESEHHEVAIESNNDPSTKIVADLAMIMQENSAEFLGYYFTLPTTLPMDAKIVSAQLVFVNSKNNQRITYPYRLYAEKSKNPAPLSLDNPISHRLENATTSFGVYDNSNLQWAQGARWTVDVTVPIQELSYKQVLGNQLVLIAENKTTSHQYLNYTFNEYVVSLEIQIAGVHQLQNSVKSTIRMDNSILAAINEIPSLEGMLFEYQDGQLIAEKEQVKFIFSVQDIELNHEKKAMMYTDIKGQIIFTTTTGYMITTTPVLQKMSTLQTALQDFGLSQWNVNQEGHIKVTVDAGTFVFRPAMSSEPAAYQLPQGIQMQGDVINFAFMDEQGQLRQQLLYPAAENTDNLLKIIKMLPYTHQVTIDEMGYVSFALADKTYRGLLSYQLDVSTTKDKAGLYELVEDINQDGEVDYRIIYDNKKLQLLISQRLTVN